MCLNGYTQRVLNLITQIPCFLCIFFTFDCACLHLSLCQDGTVLATPCQFLCLLCGWTARGDGARFVDEEEHAFYQEHHARVKRDEDKQLVTISEVEEGESSQNSVEETL